MQYLDQIPDGIKITGAIAAPALTFLGVSVEQWTFVLSAIVSLLFIVEKLPVFIRRCKEAIQWIRDVKRRKKE